MKYLDLSAVVDAYINFQNTMTNKSWGYLALIRGCKSEIKPCVPFEVDMDSVSNFLETIFNLSSEKKTYNSTKSWYVVFSNQWSDFFSTQGKNIANIYDIAVWAFRRKAFDDKDTAEDILSKFINEFNLPAEVINSKFSINSNGVSFSNTIYDENILKDELSKQGVNVSTENIDAKKSSVVAAPGELSRGPFIQTLYAGLEISDYILIMQSNYFNLYSINPSNVYNSSSVNPPLQQIFYGAPGTGKSNTIKREVEDKGRIHFRTTFHPDSDYSTFVGCYKPTKNAAQVVVSIDELIKKCGEYAKRAGYNNQNLTQFGFDYCRSLEKASKEEKDFTYISMLSKVGVTDTSASSYVTAGMELYNTLATKIAPITYEFVPQAFTKAYCEAWNRYDGTEDSEPVFLIIEEINRGNCAQIFGDIFQLLDRKGGFSEYPIDADEDLKKFLQNGTKEDGAPWLTNNGGIKDGKLCLPPNLHIWATMNTSDQSLFPIDSAFKRRWDWKYVPIDYDKETWNIVAKGEQYLWSDFLMKMNNLVASTTDSEDKMLGFYFAKAQNGIIDADTFVGKVVFYLWNDVFKDYGLPKEILNGAESKEFAFRNFFMVDGHANEDMVKRLLDNLEVAKPADANLPVEDTEIAPSENA